MADYICSACGYVGKKKKKTRGSIIAALLLWILTFVIIFFGLIIKPLLLLGLILLAASILYSGYILFFPRIEVCPKCGSEKTMIPTDSPRGQELYRQLYEKQSQQEK